MSETQIEFTEAQREHLARLIDERDQATAAVNAFVSYLQREYNASPDQGWTHCDPKGFTRARTEADDDSGTA